MGLLINIDNGGTLTDFCVVDGAHVYRTKSITTPYDLSKCFFDGLRKVSRTVYGREDILKLLLSTDHIRYSTTQGTNALVERKGPRLGLILSGVTSAELKPDVHSSEVFDSLVGTRFATLDLSETGVNVESEVTRTVIRLASEGANRIVIAVAGLRCAERETLLKNILLRKFPPHLLGAIPILYSHELVPDEDDSRRIWTAMFNAFLHPAMERFLYSAEHRLREYKTRNPLLIFRNDGESSRVARTAAVKTYSSGPRGGAEGIKALAAHYGFDRVIGMDIGGTTTDISYVEQGNVRIDRRGKIDGIATSLPLCNVTSTGIGGSSIIKTESGSIKVGPESVGGAPGPACFGLGGKEATITDAFLTMGLLDPRTYFGGELKIDIERARAAIDANVAKPLKLTPDTAAQAMETAWVEKVAQSLRDVVNITPATTLVAFGGAGPFVVCRIAEQIGINRIVIPGLAAVFCAFGLGFSDIAHDYEASFDPKEPAALSRTIAQLRERAKRGMFAEGFDIDDCSFETSLRVDDDVTELAGDSLPRNIPAASRVTLLLKVIKHIGQPELSGEFGRHTAAAKASEMRRILSAGRWVEVPLYRMEELSGGSRAAGPAVLEEAFFTCRVEAGWEFERDPSGDILLTRATEGSKA